MKTGRRDVQILSENEAWQPRICKRVRLICVSAASGLSLHHIDAARPTHASSLSCPIQGCFNQCLNRKSVIDRIAVFQQLPFAYVAKVLEKQQNFYEPLPTSLAAFSGSTVPCRGGLGPLELPGGVPTNIALL